MAQDKGSLTEEKLRSGLLEIIGSILLAEPKYLGYDKGFGVQLDPFIDKIITLIASTKEAECQARVERMKILTLQAIADEPEYPSDMPDELWQELKGNQPNVIKAMRSTVLLTKNGITGRFLQALKEEEGVK